jgi:iron-sulfur cluster assembly accessory protein
MRDPLPPEPLVPDITVTPRAAQEVQRIIREEQRQERVPRPRYLRYRIEGDGAVGFRGHIDLDPETRPNDLRVETQGLVVVLDRRTALLGSGSVIDYIDTPAYKGFKIHNPNAKPSGSED